MIDKFLAYLKTEKNYSPHTLIAYRKDIDDLAAYIEGTLSLNLEEPASIRRIKNRHLRGWMKQLSTEEKSFRTIARKLAAVKSFFKYLHRSELIEANPASKVVVPSFEKKLPSLLKVKEAQTLFSEIEFEQTFEGQRDRLMMELLYGCGIRRSELISLAVKDIDFHLQQLRVLGKGNKERIVPFGKAVQRALNSYQAEAEAEGISLVNRLLVRKNGKALYPNLVYRRVGKYIKMVSYLKNVGPHVLRHSFATHLLDNGADLNAIKELLGHSSLAATQVYTHTTIEKLKKTYKQSHPRSSTINRNDYET